MTKADARNVYQPRPSFVGEALSQSARSTIRTQWLGVGLGTGRLG